MKTRLTLRSPTIRVVGPLGVGDQIMGEALDETSSASAEPLRLPVDKITHTKARSVMLANVGEPKILVLAPDAELSDGLIDVIVVDALTSLLGWADVIWKILGQLIGLRPINLPVSTDKAAFRQARGASVTAEEAQVCQVDDDAVGLAHTMHIRMQAGALDIAVPAERTWMELLPGQVSPVIEHAPASSDTRPERRLQVQRGGAGVRPTARTGHCPQLRPCHPRRAAGP